MDEQKEYETEDENEQTEDPLYDSKSLASMNDFTGLVSAGMFEAEDAETYSDLYEIQLAHSPSQLKE